MKLFYGFVLCKNYDKNLITDEFTIYNINNLKYDTIGNNSILCYEVEDMGNMIASVCLSSLARELEERNGRKNKDKNEKLMNIFNKIYANETEEDIEDNQPMYFVN
jgi:predicted kinase